jgi:iron complex transport system permease protein
VRLPRVLVGFVAGGALAVAGTALQGLFRNPLAEPGVLGISSGASLGAVLAIYFHIAGRPCGCCPRARSRAPPRRRAGVLDRARHGRGQVFTATLLLVGVALMALNVSLTTFVLRSRSPATTSGAR